MSASPAGCELSGAAPGARSCRAATAEAISSAARRTPARSVRQMSRIWATSSRMPGFPKRLSSGKYVPAKNGLPSAVMTIVSGQPPLPVSMVQTSM